MGYCSVIESVIEEVFQRDKETISAAASKAAEIIRNSSDYVPITMALAGSILLRSAMLNYYITCRGEYDRSKCVNQALAIASFITSDTLSTIAKDVYDAISLEPHDGRLDEKHLDRLRDALDEEDREGEA